MRLLVDNKTISAYKKKPFKPEWLLTSSNSIPNPYIVINEAAFPLKLKTIILGPNMNDVDTILVQLRTMLKQKGVDAEVKLSDKTGYRNPIK